VQLRPSCTTTTQPCTYSSYCMTLQHVSCVVTSERVLRWPLSNSIEMHRSTKRAKLGKETNKRLAPYKLDSSFSTFSFDYRTASSWAGVFFNLLIFVTPFPVGVDAPHGSTTGAPSSSCSGWHCPTSSTCFFQLVPLMYPKFASFLWADFEKEVSSSESHVFVQVAS
jgi:hypothetical protein